jgi:enolase-phosphatase E1
VPLPEGVRAVLLDIEGTTTPLAFVHDVLFPAAAARLDAFCARAEEEPDVARAIERLRVEYQEEARRGVALPEFGSGAPYARHLMKQDRKSTGLKLLQGLIWEEGYRDGSLHGEVFRDVPEALAAWRRAGVRLRVFSSGSVLAQRLLFGHTAHGDLAGFFEGFHDTTTGAKRDAASYRRIAEAFGVPAGSILFLSDVLAELDAAADAGLRTGLCVRPGNPPVEAASRHPCYTTLVELT